MAAAFLRSRSLLVLALAVPGSVALAAPAHAAGTSSVSVVSGVLTVNSAPGAGNALTLVGTVNSGLVPIVRVSEPALLGGTLTVGAGCIQTDTRTVECVRSGITSYVVNTGDNNDTVNTSGLSLPGTFNGGDGNDVFRPGSAAEVFNGGLGSDLVDYSARTAAVTVTLDNVANDGASLELDNIKSDVERVTGGGGSDTLTGSASANTLTGGAGNDVLSPAGGTDVVSGGLGTDKVSYAERLTGVSVSLDGVANDGGTQEADNIQTDVENIVGSRGIDTLVGSVVDNLIDGGPGADSIRGSRGIDTVTYAARSVGVSVSKDAVANDGSTGEGDNVAVDVEVVVGGTGPDKLVGSAGNDTFDGGPGADDVTGLGGTDTMTYASRTAPVTVTTSLASANDGEAGEADTVRPDVENIIGGSAADSLTGSGGVNLLEGRAGNDTLQGLGGADVVNGGPGSDSISGGPAVDTATYADRTAALTLTLDGFTNDGEAGEADTIQIDVENLVGGSGNDSLTGNASANLLDGGLGADVLNGGGGVDTATYATRTLGVTADSDGVADDGVAGEKDNVGADVENLTGGSGPDTLTGNIGPAVLTGGPGADLLFGTPQADTLIGLEGNDSLYGRAGTDAFDGGSGIDTVSYSLASGPVVADLDGVADDGPVGENENLGATIESIEGGPYKDTLTGNDGPNSLDGGFVNFGQTPTDLLRGLGGNDTMSAGADCRGSLGDDTASFCTAAYGDAGNDTLAGTRVYGGEGNDDLIGRFAYGGAGADRLKGGGDDWDSWLDGGAGPDTFKGPGTVRYDGRVNPVATTPDGVANDGESGEGDNILPGGLTPFFEVGIVGGSGNDKLSGNRVKGGAGNDIITGGSFPDRLEGGPGSDQIAGNSHNDVLLPGPGNDTVTGGSGYDIFYASDGADVMDGGVSEVDQYVATYMPGPVKISLNGLADDGRTGELDNVKGMEIVWGTSSNDQLAGSTLADELYGLGGNDTLAGGAHSDRLFGGDGADSFSGGLESDACDYVINVDTLSLSCEETALNPRTVPPAP